MNSTTNISRRKLLGAGAATATAMLGAAGIGAAEAEAAPAGKPDSLLAPTYKSHFGHDVTSDAVHAGEDSGCSSYPIYQGTTNRGAYTRNSNPTINSVEVKIKRLEGAEFGIATACGMAAISQTLTEEAEVVESINNIVKLYFGELMEASDDV